MDAGLVPNALVHTALNLFLLAILTSPLWFLLRREIGAWVSKGPWRGVALLAAIVLPVGACTYRQQLYAPALPFSASAAQHWIDKAAAAPTQEERVMHVRRVAAQSEYGGHIAWQGISKHPDRKMRCDLYAIVMATPNVRATSNVEEALKKECAD